MSGYTLTENAPLTGRNTFRLHVRAKLLAEVRQASALQELFAFAMLRDGPVLVIGEGSNLLLVDDVPGVVVSLAMHGISILENDGASAVVRAEAGVPWNDFVQYTLGHGLAGLENLSLIPGTVGAAPIQNIGAYGVEVADYVDTVEAFDRERLCLERLDRGQCRFGYRDSLFKQQAGRWVVTAVEFRLPREAPPRLEYAGICEELASMGVEHPRPSQVAEAVIRLRTRKLPNPALVGNAGSFFKNPVVRQDVADRLAGQHPGLPVFASGVEGMAKISAAWMIEACGWKGHRDGDAGISDMHALVLVNHGHASGRELLALARRVAASVSERFGVSLEPEPRVIGATFGPRDA